MLNLLVKLQFPTSFPRVIRRYTLFLTVYHLTHISNFYKLALVFVHMHLFTYFRVNGQMHVDGYMENAILRGSVFHVRGKEYDFLKLYREIIQVSA